ncbi:PAS domain-containing sensor histidine kinase [Porphyromonas gulae]|uniref:two-component system sensor histidine kinase PorY n=1 Tax=Porphyromonas gulae TaxID=111105 RepID=UPI0026F1CCC7|nr:HAMP domain-containing sensor histidine kinase [Porphyromonas gulae]
MGWSGNQTFFERSRITMRVTFIFAAMVIAILTLFASDRLIEKMAAEERQKIELWAQATKIAASDNDAVLANDLVLQIIQSNNSIPVILCDPRDSILSYNNIAIPAGKPALPYLQKKLRDFKEGYPPIRIEIEDRRPQFLYYSDSQTLRGLLVLPYVALSVIFVFLGISIIALLAERRSEQNRVWNGLSKETAHQLGTPISSLMAWVELLKASEVDQSIPNEMEKDVDRLRMIAERFQKVGSEPKTELQDVRRTLGRATDYMRYRISRQVDIELRMPDEVVCVALSAPLFSWVIENMIKNAVDAMSGNGTITIELKEKGSYAVIDITDTGKGIPKGKMRDIFRPGYSTKTRGWGLGLSLAKRIIEKYHKGKISVKQSEPGIGTTFRILLPKQTDLP